MAALALVLGGCGPGARGSAAGGIAGFLDAVHRGDKAAFEAQLDRPALRADIRHQLMAFGRTRGLEVEGGASEFALDRMIAPHAFHLVDAKTGQPLANPPTAAQVAPLLKTLAHGGVCVRDPAQPRCLMVFAKQRRTWKLIAMPASDLTIPIDVTKK